jgi:hypothetical protein
MKTFASVLIGAFVGCVVASAIVHRRVIAAAINGDPMPEPPEWHKNHPCFKHQ